MLLGITRDYLGLPRITRNYYGLLETSIMGLPELHCEICDIA